MDRRTFDSRNRPPSGCVQERHRRKGASPRPRGAALADPPRRQRRVGRTPRGAPPDGWTNLTAAGQHRRSSGCRAASRGDTPARSGSGRGAGASSGASVSVGASAGASVGVGASFGASVGVGASFGASVGVGASARVGVGAAETRPAPPRANAPAPLAARRGAPLRAYRHLLLADRRAGHQDLPVLRRPVGTRQALLRGSCETRLCKSPGSPRRRGLTALPATPGFLSVVSSALLQVRQRRMRPLPYQPLPYRLATFRQETSWLKPFRGFGQEFALDRCLPRQPIW